MTHLKPRQVEGVSVSPRQPCLPPALGLPTWGHQEDLPPSLKIKAQDPTRLSVLSAISLTGPRVGCPLQ